MDTGFWRYSAVKNLAKTKEAKGGTEGAKFLHGIILTKIKSSQAETGIGSTSTFLSTTKPRAYRV